ncbi:MAG: hydrogenase iron-sulfur subunit [Candidatus Bathyarchaeota archaeon]
MSYEPKIVGFLCNWCSYAGADLAGVSRFQYPTNLRVIRVMCSGRVHPAHILEAFKNGADGVLVAGCHPPNDCHYISGNLKAKRRVAMLKKLMDQMGMDPERLRLEWVSAAEGEKFARLVTEFTNMLKDKGPCQLKAVLAQEAD